MNDILKQRLVGALILLALGVVFWPVIFVEPDEEKSVERAIPPESEVSTARIDKPIAQAPVGGALPTEQAQLTEELASPAPSAPTAAPTVVSDATPVTTARPESPQGAATDSAGVAWTLQVATVSSSEKAQDLRRKLLEMKQDVYVTTVRSGDQNLYRVCIGRKLERVELEKLQAVVNTRFGVTSMVVRYTP